MTRPSHVAAGYLLFATSGLLALGAALSLLLPLAGDELSPFRFSFVVVLFALVTLPVGRAIVRAADVRRAALALPWIFLNVLLIYVLAGTNAFNVGYAAAQVTAVASFIILAYLRLRPPSDA